MSLEQPTTAELFNSPTPIQQRVMNFVDAEIGKQIQKELDELDFFDQEELEARHPIAAQKVEIEHAIDNRFASEEVAMFALAYLQWRMRDTDEEDEIYDRRLERYLTDENMPKLEPEPFHIPEQEPEPEPSPTHSRVPGNYTEAMATMKIILASEGWRNFKERMSKAFDWYRVDVLCRDAGIGSVDVNRHFLIVGNQGTGKTTAAQLMAELYWKLAIVYDEEIVTTRVSDLSTSTINGEYEKFAETAKKAGQGTLIFEDAHELYHPDSKNYDSERHIIQALVDTIEMKEKTYAQWLLILTGEREGIESLMAANPSLARHFAPPIYLDDFTPDEITEIARLRCFSKDLIFGTGSLAKLHSCITHRSRHQENGAINAHLAARLIDDEIIPAMYNRIAMHGGYDDEDMLRMVMPEDIPSVGPLYNNTTAELDSLVGLDKIKTKIRDFLNAVRLSGRRMDEGLPSTMPKLNMVFLGNPGTGKTTVAEIIGKAFASWGILSGGQVIRTEKSQMVGQYIGETEFKMNALLARARGNILFIDEAYQLVEGGEKDFGKIVINSLLTELGKDNPNLVVILAGYTAPMKRLLESNAGVESRFPNVFNFDDYTPDELVEIGKMMLRKDGFILTEGAEKNMRTIIEKEASKPSPRFGNGRFVSNLLRNQVLATMGARTALIENPTGEQLSTILPEDVVIDKPLKDIVFDDKAIDSALSRLDSLVGMNGVKTAIHNFVGSVRYLHSIGEPYVGGGLLSWRFVGNTGTGKSTVAEIMAAILRGMRLISNSNIVEIKGERIFNVSESDCDKVLEDAVKKSCNGLLFIDADDEKFGYAHQSYGRSVEQIRLKIQELTLESGGECALILAELDAPNRTIAEQLSESGIHEFDHTLIFKDFTHEELYGILCACLKKHNVTFTPEAEEQMLQYLHQLSSSAKIKANARTMKLFSRTIYRQVILRESALPVPPQAHQVQLQDISSLKWNSSLGRIGF